MPRCMYRFALVSVAVLLPSAVAVSQTALNLFNGTSTQGWQTNGAWTVAGGSLTSNGTGDRALVTAVPFGDFNLQFEYNESAQLNATLRFWATRENTGGLTVQLDTTGAKDGVGGITGLSHSSLKTVSPGWHKVAVEASHGVVTTRVDGQPSGSASGLGTRGGYLSFQVSGQGQFQVRNVRLLPLNGTNLFNGSDLSGWKSVARAADSKGGVGHSAAKVFSFGMAGGSDKPHEAKWTVRGGALHGEAGPGALENSTMLEDGVIVLTATSHGDVKPENFTALSLRNPSGQMGGGYPVGLGAFSGSVQDLSKVGYSRANAPIEETVVIGGRTIAIWVGGNLVSIANDTRPDAGKSSAGAHTQAGVMSLLLPSGGSQMDVARISATALQKPYGLTPHAPPPPPTPVVSTATTPVVPPVAGTSPAEAALLQQQQETARKDAETQANKQQVASLMGAALASNDPQQQEDLYGQVIKLDPSNPNAMQGYKEAQTKLQQQQTAAAANVASQQSAQGREQQTNSALVSAQSAFLAGHLSEASRSLSIAEQLSPGNPFVRELRNRISVAQSLRTRLWMLGGGVGFVSLLAAFTLWLRRRKQQKHPALEVTSGLDEGKVYPIDKDRIRIGAVPQDGGQKNDIVVRDVEHAISRFHCELVKRGGQVYVQDLNSSNGTRLNGQRLKPGTPELLRKGSRLQLAETVELRFGYARKEKKG